MNMVKSIVNKRTQLCGGVKPSSNATFHERVNAFFESIQVVSSRINEVHCGILEKIKRYRNKCGMTALAKAVAFTLAETLVVMGIIGVVAALTIPNLNQSTGDREKVAKLKKVYANLEDAYGRATAVYGPIEEWFVNDSSLTEYSQRFADRMTEFMKISKTCKQDEAGCFGDGSYLDLGGDEDDDVTSWDEPKVLLADGTALDFYVSQPNCSSILGATEDSPVSKTCGLIYVDIDGSKGANTGGKDYFYFYITSTGIYPYGGKNSNIGKNESSLKATCFSVGYSCTGWVIETGNMDYLKASNGKCPNGTTLSWENTSCK